MPEELKPINLPGKPRKFVPLDDSGPAQITGNLAYRQSKDTLEALFASVPVDTGAKQSTVYQSEVDDLLTGRYNNVIYGANNEDIHGRTQGILDKAVNGTLKGVGLAATTFVGGLGLLYGIGKSFGTHKLSDVWQNEVSESLDAINKEVDDKYLPNYYTEKESNAAWYSSDNLFTANFLFDKLVKNAGFAVGAIYSGNLASKGLGIVGGALGGMFDKASKYTEAWKTFSDINKGASRLFSQGKNIEAAEILKKGISTIADAEKASAEMLKISNKFLGIEGVQDFTRKSIMSLYSSAGESSFESIGTASSFRENKIQEFRDKWGYDPTGEELDKINELSKEVGNASFMANMAVLSATEFTQLPYLMGSSYKTGKATSNAFKTAEDVAMKEGKYVAKGASRLSKAKSFITSYIFDPKESLQEYLQTSIDVGVQDYYNKAYEGKEAKSLTEAFINAGTSGWEALKTAITSKEGGESILLGGISGGLMQAKGKIKERKYKSENTNSFLQDLNVPDSTFTDAFNDRVNSLQRGIVLQQKGEQALNDGDKLEFLDNKYDQTHNYLSTRVKYGRTDMVIDDINDRRMHASSDASYKNLQATGGAPLNMSRTDYNKKLNEFEQHAKTLTSLYESSNLIYQGKLNSENQRMYSDVVIDKMVYAADKITDYDFRIPQLNTSLIGAGITKTQDILDSIIKDNKPNKQATAEALNQINDLDVTKETKDELKTNLSDIIELALRRKLFIEQHNDIVENPSRYESTPEFKFGETKEVPVVVSQDNIAEPKKKLEIGKEYSLAEPFRKEGTQLQLAPKITVLSQTLGGELEVKLPNGKTSFMTPEEFDNFTISDENNTSQEVADLLDAAIDVVLKDEKYADIKKELTEASKELGDNKIDKIGWINSLDNQSLIDDIENELGVQTNALFETRDRIKKEAEQLKKNKEDIIKQQNEIEQSSGDVGTNNPANDKVVPEGKLLDAKIMFISGTSESEATGYYIDENGEVKDPAQADLHIRNSREFLNNVGGFKNRANMRVILVTPALAKAYGLEGLVQMSYGKASDFDVNEIPNVNDVKLGFIAQVFVEQVGDRLFFVDKNGNQLGEVGNQLENVSDVIFQTMRTDKLTYNDNKTPRYRKNQKEEAEAYAAAWTKQRAEIFATESSAPPAVYGFQVSRGIGEKTKDGSSNHIAGTLIDKDQEKNILAKDQTLIQIPITGIVAHHTGEINMPNGRPVLVHQDNVEFLNNIQFSGKRAEGIYQVINQIATEMNDKSKAGKKVVINKKLSRFLQNVLYWRKGTTTEGSNQININEETLTISFAGKSYSLPEIASRKDELLEDIKKAFHNVNNTTLGKDLFSKTFTEYYMKDGELVSNNWTNYQTYLLSSTYPNGSARSVEDTPLSTKIAKPSLDIPYTHKQKYATLQGLELPVGVIAKPAKAETVIVAPVKTERKYDYDGDTENIFTIPSFGDVIFTVKEGEDPQFDDKDDTFIATRNNIIDKLRETRKDASQEELTKLANGAILGLVKKELETDVVTAEAPTAEEVVAEAPVVTPAPVSDIEAKKADIEKRKNKLKENEISIIEVNGTFDIVHDTDGVLGERYSSLAEAVITAEKLFDIDAIFEDEDSTWSSIGINDFENYKSKEELIKAINAKYDAELAALEGTTPAETPKESGSFDVKNIKKRGNMFRKVGVLTKIDRMSEADLKAFKEWHAKNLPTIPFEVLENMININSTEKAFGVFEDGVAKFVKGGLRGTEYHEVGEAIWNGMLSPEEQQALIAEFRNKSGQFLDRETDEKYNYDDPTVTDQMVKERILDDFADFRVGKLPARSLGEAVVNFFRRLLEFFKQFVMKPSMKEQLFKAIEAGEFKDRQLSAESKTMPPQYRRAGHLTEEQTNAYVKDMTILSAAIILGNGDIGTIDKSAIYDLRKLTSDNVFNKIKELYTEQEVIQEIGEIAWKDLVKKTKQELKVLLKVDFNDEDLVNINEGETNKNDYAREPFSTDWKKNAPMGIKFVSATIPEAVATNQENSTSFKLPDLKVNPKTETYSLVPYTRVFSTMLDKLKNTSSIGKAVNKLIGLANKDANYVRMFKTLGGNLNNKTINFKDFKFEDWRLFIEMMQTYTKQKPNAVIEYVSQGRTISRSAIVTGIVDVTTRGWMQNMRNLAIEPDSYIKLDRSVGTYEVTDLSAIPTSTPQDKVDFLAKLGIIFPIEAWSKLKKDQVIDFTLTVDKIKEYLQEAKEIMNIKKRTLDIAGQLDTLATMYVGVTNPNQETTRINIDGKQSNSFADNNTPSVFENEFNEAATLDELLKLRPELNDVYSKGSQLLKKGGQFFDAAGNRTSLQLKLGYIEGKKNIDDNKGTTSVKLTVGDRFTQEINQNLNGNYYVLIPADGSTEWMMNMGNNISFEDVEQGTDGWKEINKIFRGYLTDDIALALDAENREQLRNVGDKAKELRFFKDILSDDVLSKINKMILAGDTQDDIEEYVKNNIEKINDSIKAFINNTVTNTRNILIENGQIKVTGEDQYSYVGLNDTFAKNEGLNQNNLTFDDITNVLTFANANYIINNIEFHKTIFGDPYQFEIKEDGSLDETKRIKSFLSPRRTTFDSPEFNTFLNEEFNNAGEIELESTDPGYHNNKSYTNTVTFSDVKIVGSIASLKNVSKEVKKAFAKTNEADAASFMMDGTYREVKFKNGQWSQQAEDFHQWQMAWTRQNMPEYTYTNKALEAHDKALVKTKEPKHTIEILKPIVSGVTANSNKINLVLDKFSQMPIYYSMVKGTTLEKLYVKMMKADVGYAIMISGRKVGAEALHDLYTPTGEFNDAAFNNNIEVPWKAYGIQVENSYEGPGEQTRGSQLTKISTLDLYENGEAIGSTPEKREEIAKETKRNREILNDLHRNGYERFLKRLGIQDLGGSFKITDKKALAKTLQDEMFRRELSDNVKDSIQLDEQGEFLIPFEASPAYLQIKSILYSFVDKAITSPKMNGGSYVQAPVTGWENAKKGRKIAIKTEDGYKQITRQEYDKLSDVEKGKVVLTDDTLKFYVDEKGKRHCEVMLPHWFRANLGKHGLKTDAELIEWINNSPDGKEILSGIGFRIPTQSLSSVEVFTVKGFLPQYMGKTVVVPSEITTKAGSDFDIDKLNMYLKATYIDLKGDIRLIRSKGTEQATKDFYGEIFEEKTVNTIVNKMELLDAIDTLMSNGELTKQMQDKYGDYIDRLYADLTTGEEIDAVRDRIQKDFDKLTDDQVQDAIKESFVEDMYRRSLENDYYDSLEKLITLPENFERLISPVNDAGLKDISDELDVLRGEDETTIKNRMLDRNYLTKLRHAFVTAKRWVGIAAVNITGVSLYQKAKIYIDPARFKNVSKDDRDILNYGDGDVLLDHNKLEVNGKKYISLSGRLDAIGKFISDGLSGYATSFVDVAKNPYILKIIKSDLSVGTFMFLQRIGVPMKQAIMFMNQPIISEYLTMLDNKNVKTLFDTRMITEIQYKFPSTVTQKDITGFNKTELADNIKNYYATKVNEQGTMYTKDLGDYKNHEQVNILFEFLKYAKMAEYNFKLGQASNYDTTKFQTGDSLSLKQWRTEAAEKQNIISSVGDILENNFIGVQADYLDDAMEALGEALPLEKAAFTRVTDRVLESFSKDLFLSKDKWDKIANKVKASFLDYVIQKRTDVATNLNGQLVDEKTSVAQMLTKAKKDFPGVQILEDLEVDSSGRIGGAQTIKLKVNDKLAYNENMYTGMMRELRDNPSTNDLYKGIVRLAILQGTYQSAISIKNIIPIEDYSAYITPMLAGLQVDEEIAAFGVNNEFQKNEFLDNDVVPILEPRFKEVEDLTANEDEPRRFQAALVKVGKVFLPGAFPMIEGLGIKSKNRQILLLNAKYNAKVINYDVIKVPRTISIDKKKADEGKIDVATGMEITNQTYAEKAKKGDTSLKNFYGYQKVKYADGSPLIASYDRDGNPVYVYKFVNLHGDGQYATEYYGDGRPSIFNNGTQKNVKNIDGTIVSNELSDKAIIDYYGGETVPQDVADPIIATIEKEAEALAPTQPVVEVKKKELFTTKKGREQKSFRGKTLNFVDKIPTNKETVVAMSNNRQTGVISIDINAMTEKYFDDAWTKPAKQLDGSFSTRLAENEFGTFNEWLTFALIHEVKHDTILKQEGETTGQYEDRINQAALADLRENYNIEELKDKGSIVYDPEEDRVGKTVGSDKEGYVNVEFDGDDEVYEFKRDALELSDAFYLREASRYESIEVEVGNLIRIDNSDLRLLSVDETDYLDTKFLRLQSRSGLIVPATITYDEETGKSEIEPNPTADDLGLEDDEYNTDDFKC